MTKSKQVFLSYGAKPDAAAAKKLYNRLSQLPNVRVWYDNFDLTPGMRIDREIRRAIRESRFFIALLSKRSSSEPGYRNSELRQAIEIMDEFPEDHVFVIPTRLDDCEPPIDYLTKFLYANLFPDWEAGFADLCRGLRVRPAAKEKLAANKTVKKKGTGFARMTARRKSPADYHYRVSVVDLDGNISDLKTVARAVNQIQSFFYLQYADLRPSRKALLKVDGVPHLNITDLSSRFYDKISPLEMDHVVCITDRLLQFEHDDVVFYNYLGAGSPDNERVTFASIRELPTYAEDAGVSFEVALAYSLVTDLASYFLDLDLDFDDQVGLEYHESLRGCPMDFTEDHARMVKGLKKGKFCASCSRKLNANPSLKRAVEEMLQWGR